MRRSAKGMLTVSKDGNKDLGRDGALQGDFKGKGIKEKFLRS